MAVALEEGDGQGIVGVELGQGFADLAVVARHVHADAVALVFIGDVGQVPHLLDVLLKRELVAAAGGRKDRAGVVEQVALGRLQALAEEVIVGQGAGAASAATGNQHAVGAAEFVLEIGDDLLDVGGADVMEGDGVFLAGRIFVNGHAVAGVDVAGAVRDEDLVPLGGLDVVAGDVVLPDERRDQTHGAAALLERVDHVEKAHVVLGNAVGVGGPADAGLAGAGVEVPARTARLEVEGQVVLVLAFSTPA